MRSDRLHVAHVVLSLETGGLERVVLSLVREGLKLGQQVSVLCVERPGKLAAEVQELGAEVQCLDKPPGVKVSTFAKSGRVLKLLRADIVHTHQIGSLLYGGYAAWTRGIPVVHTEHGNHYTSAPRTACWLARAAALSCDRFFCVSQDIAKSIVAQGIAPSAKIEYIPNGIDTGKFEGGARAVVRGSLAIPAHAVVIGTVGNLREVKRQDVLIRGFARLASSCQTPLRLLIVGGGVLQGDLTALANQLGLSDKVIFAGHQPKPEQYLQAMDVFALTSRSEGMPLAVLEAWAAGLPVVASRVGGLPELIEPDRTGLLFTAGEVEELAIALTGLVNDPERSRRMGEAGREVVRRRFDAGVMAKTYQDRYLMLLGQRHQTQTAG